jgi:hypothetical protein
MLIENVSIIGCGTVGANLSIELSKNNIKQLKIYDCDLVSDNNEIFMPFEDHHKKLYKVDVIKYFVKKHSECFTNVFAFKEVVHNPINDDSFIIDCRDRKSSYIKPNLEISLDGNFLNLNSMNLFKKELHRSTKYFYKKNHCYILKAMEEIMIYLKNREYLNREFRIYNLKRDRNYEVVHI